MKTAYWATYDATLCHEQPTDLFNSEKLVRDYLETVPGLKPTSVEVRSKPIFESLKERKDYTDNINRKIAEDKLRKALTKEDIALLGLDFLS